MQSNAKGRNIAYWITTGLLTAGMLSGGIAQLIRAPWNTQGIIHLGYPVYVMTILGTWKLLGVTALLLPRMTLIKEWAYAGFFFLMTGAVISHLVSGDGLAAVTAQSIFVVLIVLSWYLRPANRRIAALTNMPE
ncbi:DoxX family protein [Chitinophaga sp. G-6-1-13]|uniref:DoxX family protein n=1 Tax=Chitinophaga fulva TaxID=2728842 RepID=A0A848GQT4_9BACT|nr:DoxX family protein [Chitinophaga fulva]NML40337.1 DoxX family protein [Chitinophaga fulva]